MTDFDQGPYDPHGLRSNMPVVSSWTYFDHAAVGPLPRPAAEVVKSWLDEITASGDVNWPRWHQAVESLRHRTARLVGASATEIALVPNTTTGIGLIAEGLDWKPGENVVVPANEFPSNLFPWLNLRSRGVDVRTVPVENGVIDPNRIDEACDGSTRLVTASWVGFLSGDRCDPSELAAIAHRHGALFFLDAIQGLGVFPLNVEQAGIDFLAADGHKWLLGPEGAGVLYIRHEHLDRLHPMMVGWSSAAGGGTFTPGEMTLRDEAARYEGGTLNQVGFMALDASLTLLERTGLTSEASPAGDYLVGLTNFAVEQLVQRGAMIDSPRRSGHESGIVTFDWPGHRPDAIRSAALAANIVLSVRLGKLRISPHVYQKEDDITRLLNLLEQYPVRK